MSDIKRLIESLSKKEDELRSTSFVAPSVRGGQVRARVSGLVYTFKVDPSDFEGWGVFLPLDEVTAGVVEEADLPLMSQYLKLFEQVRLRLAVQLSGRTWIAYPANESDARQRLGAARPVAVHLVSEPSRFEQITARWDGSAFWHEDADRRADPEIAELMRAALRDGVEPRSLGFKGVTPAMRITYGLAVNPPRPQSLARRRRRPKPEDAPPLDFRDDGERLRDALQVGGGSLVDYHDRGEFWLVEWTTSDGEQHSSAISKRDLTVIGAGICLSGRDRDFDLQSLVGVVERQ